MSRLKSVKWWFKASLILIAGLSILLSVVVGIAYQKQDKLIQDALTTLNESFRGQFILEDSHISPFANFPYVSIDPENVKLIIPSHEFEYEFRLF